MGILPVVILLFQSNHAIKSQPTTALGVAQPPKLPDDVLPDVGAMPDKCRQIVTQMIQPAVTRLFRQLGQFTPDSLEVIKSDAKIHFWKATIGYFISQKYSFSWKTEKNATILYRS
jgi:hypothetical protein